MGHSAPTWRRSDRTHALHCLRAGPELVSVRSDRLGNVAVVGALGGVVIFTVPAGETWLVKRVCTEGDPILNTVLRYRMFPPSGTDVALYRVTLNGLGVDDHETWWAFDAGTELRLSNESAGTLKVQCFGAKLLGVA